jgi:hypothetical protein
MSQNAVGWHGGPVRARGLKQLAILQLRDCALHRAFGKTGFISEHIRRLALTGRQPCLAARLER